MTTESIQLPGSLIQKVLKAAARQQITPEKLVRDAVEARLRRGEWRKILEFGRQNARERDLTPEDIGTEIMADRAERGLECFAFRLIQTSSFPL